MRCRFALPSAVGLLLVGQSALAQPAPPNPPAEAPGQPPAAAPGDKPPEGKPGDAKPGAKPGEAKPGEAPTAPPPEAPPPEAPPPETPPPEAAPPETPPPAASPPVTPAPVTSPSMQPVNIPPAGPVDQGPQDKPGVYQPESTLAIELDAGLNRRFGDSADYGFESRSPAGLTFGPGVWFSPERLWEIGLSYKHTSLGSDKSVPGDESLTVRRNLDALWLGGRAYPWRTDAFGVFLLLELGMSWQHAQADGTHETTAFVRPPEVYTCSASDGPGFALGGGLGMNADLDSALSFIAQVDATAHRHTSEPLGDCAPGSGSVTSLAAQVGFAYRFDLNPSNAPARADTFKSSTIDDEL